MYVCVWKSVLPLMPNLQPLIYAFEIQIKRLQRIQLGNSVTRPGSD